MADDATEPSPSFWRFAGGWSSAGSVISSGNSSSELSAERGESGGDSSLPKSLVMMSVESVWRCPKGERCCEEGATGLAGRGEVVRQVYSETETVSYTNGKSGNMLSKAACETGVRYNTVPPPSYNVLVVSYCCQLFDSKAIDNIGHSFTASLAAAHCPAR